MDAPVRRIGGELTCLQQPQAPAHFKVLLHKTLVRRIGGEPTCLQKPQAPFHLPAMLHVQPRHPLADRAGQCPAGIPDSGGSPLWNSNGPE